MKLRTSPSDLDALRYYQKTDMDLETLLARLRRESEPSEAMLAGKALHALLEHAGECELEHAERDGYVFRFAFDGELPITSIRELKAEKVYQIENTEVTLAGVVDAMDGITVGDHKLTARFDAESYMSALQWRLYLDMFDASAFVYNVFEGGPDRNGVYVIRDFHRVPLYRYPGLHDDVVSALRRFVEFAREYLPERLVA